MVITAYCNYTVITCNYSPPFSITSNCTTIVAAARRVISESQELEQGVADLGRPVLAPPAVDESFSVYPKTLGSRAPRLHPGGVRCGQMLAWTRAPEAGLSLRLHSSLVRDRSCPCTRGTGVLAPNARVEYRAGLRARGGLCMVSAPPQQPWSPNSHSSHPPARADQTSSSPARRSWQKGGQVL